MYVAILGVTLRDPVVVLTLLGAADDPAALETSQLFAPSTRGWCYQPLDPAQAKGLLDGYINIYEQGLSYPLPVFPETSYSWASQADLESATQQARNAWAGNDFQGAANGENADPIARLALHNNAPEPWRDALFQEFAQRIYAPAIENGGEIE